MDVSKEILENGIKKVLDKELSHAEFYKFESERDNGEIKSRYNYSIKNKKGEEFKSGYGVYYIFDEDNKIHYIGEGFIKERLRDHFHREGICRSREKDKNGERVSMDLEEFRKNYKIKIIKLADEFSNKVKYECRTLEQASYLYFHDDFLYGWDGSKKRNKGDAVPK